jgi:hypothetical protein
MSTRELRAEARVSITRRGKVKSGDDWFPCMVLDISDSGFQIVCNEVHPVGRVLEFKCELYPGQVLECKIVVRHASEEGIGTKIVEIDKKSAGLCQLYLQEHYSHKLNRST